MTFVKKTSFALGVIGAMAITSMTAARASDPAYAYTGDPAYAASRGYSSGPGYGAYAYAPGHAYRGRRGYDARYRSAPRHYDPGAGYNSNTVAPWQDWKNQGHDY